MKILIKSFVNADYQISFKIDDKTASSPLYTNYWNIYIWIFQFTY